MEHARFSLAKGRPEDVLPLLDAGRAKYGRAGEDRRSAARFILVQAVALFARHVGPAEAAVVCAEAVSAARAAERVKLAADRPASNVHRIG